MRSASRTTSRPSASSASESQPRRASRSAIAGQCAAVTIAIAGWPDSNPAAKKVAVASASSTASR